jgi:glutathionylspermidine synthase
MKTGTYSINPPSTFISQSKTFFALLWELAEQGFFNEMENRDIHKYIPRTTLSIDNLGTDDFVLKPCLGREGQGILSNYRGIETGASAESMENCDYVYQERVDMQQVRIDIRTTVGKSEEPAFPVIGMYVAGNEPVGIFTRAGGRITDKWAVYLPTMIKG